MFESTSAGASKVAGINLSMYLSIYLSIYLYIGRERKREERERQREGERQSARNKIIFRIQNQCLWLVILKFPQ